MDELRRIFDERILGIDHVDFCKLAEQIAEVSSNSRKDAIELLDFLHEVIADSKIREDMVGLRRTVMAVAGMGVLAASLICKAHWLNTWSLMQS